MKFRILEVNYESRYIKLARSDYIGDLCPKDPLNVPFDESVLPLVPNTDLLTIYYDCNQDFSGYDSTYVGALACDDGDGKGNYYVTRNLSSPLLQESRSVFNDFRVFCDKNVSIPANGPALTTLQTSSSRDNLKKALEEGFELELNQECSRCLALQGACGYNRTSNRFACYYIVEPNDRTSKKGKISFLHVLNPKCSSHKYHRLSLSHISHPLLTKQRFQLLMFFQSSLFIPN